MIETKTNQIRIWYDSPYLGKLAGLIFIVTEIKEDNLAHVRYIGQEHQSKYSFYTSFVDTHSKLL